jgi:death-on-curing protein
MATSASATQDLLSLVVHLGVGPVRDVGLLDSAAARPRSSPFGRDAYPTLGLKAAALLQSVAKDHVLADGNKRLAWLAAVVFLDLSGHQPELTDDEAFDLVWQLAGGAVDVEEIARQLAVRRSPPGGN